MKRYLFWLKIEYKRAAALLPKIMLKAIMLVCVLGMIAFGANKLLSAQTDEQKIKIGFVAEESNMTNMLLSFVENMESVKKWCELVLVEEAEGMEMLANGELLGLAVLPENVVEEIMSGSNAPARLYLSEDLAPLALVFDELASAGVSMLQIAQAQIYATYDLFEEWGWNEEALAEICNKINVFNLSMALGREELFQTKQLSITGQDSFWVYYGGALLTMYLLLAGLFFGKYIKRSSLEQEMLEKRLGISKFAQLAGRVLVTASLLAFVMLLALPILIYWHVSGFLQMVINIQNIVLILLVIICVAEMLQFIYMLSDNHRFAVLLVAMNAVIMGYLTGCILPTPLLPQIVERVSVFLPGYYIKDSFTMLFAGKEELFFKTLLCLSGWIIMFALAARLLMRERLLGDMTDHFGAKVMPKERKMSNSMFVILAKRLLSKASLWITLVAVLVVSVVMVSAEKESKTTIYAAVYTEEAEYQKVLSEYEGMVKFYLCESEEEVKRNVIQGKAECGYVLQEDLQKEFLDGDGDRTITVYKDADSTQTRVVNEVLFERLFYVIMTEWFEGYIAEHEAFADVRQEIGEDDLRQAAKAALMQKLSDGSTFTYERQYISTAQEPNGQGEGRSVYPIHVVAWLCVLLCGMIGIREAMADRRAHKFTLNATKATVITIVQAFMCGVIAAVLLLLFTGQF